MSGMLTPYSSGTPKVFKENKQSVKKTADQNQLLKISPEIFRLLGTYLGVNLDTYLANVCKVFNARKNKLSVVYASHLDVLFSKRFYEDVSDRNHLVGELIYDGKNARKDISYYLNLLRKHPLWKVTVKSAGNKNPFIDSVQIEELQITSLNINRELFIDSDNIHTINPPTDEYLHSISKLPLKSLYIGDCSKITDLGLFFLRSLQLQSLKLDGCSLLSDSALACLGKMPLIMLHLNAFKVSDFRSPQIGDQGMASLQQLPIEKLYLQHTKITDKGMVSIASLPLKSLTLFNCYDVTPKGLIPLREKTSLNQLSMGGKLATHGIKCLVGKRAEERTDQGSILYSRARRTITSFFDTSRWPDFSEAEKTVLDTIGNVTVIDNGLYNPIRPIPLTDLSLGSSKDVTDETLYLIAKNFPTLKKLDAGYCQKITNNGLSALKPLKLTELDLSRCPDISDYGLGHLSGMPLRKLNILGSSYISPDGVCKLRAIPTLEEVVVGFSKEPSAAEKRALDQLPFRVQILPLDS